MSNPWEARKQKREKELHLKPSPPDIAITQEKNELEEPYLIDIGANLAHRRFEGDFTEVLDRAFANGVKKIIVTGTSVKSSLQAIKLAKLFPHMLFATVGTQFLFLLLFSF